jgi:ATP-binding cassette subfamily B protein
VLAEAPGIAVLETMPPDVRAIVEAGFVPVQFGFGETIVREGDEADALYVITAGAARVSKRDDDGREVPLTTIGAGDALGEVALLTGGRRVATVRASGAVEALRLDRALFSAVVAGSPAVAEWAEAQLRRHHLRNFLILRSAFGSLPTAAVATLAEALEPADCPRGTHVIEEGSPAGPMYIVREGRLRALRVGPAGDIATVGLLREGDTFGERSLLAGEPRRATVEALTDCRLLSLAPEALTRLMDEVPDLRRELEERVARYDYRNVAHVPLDFAEELLPAQAEAQATAVAEERAALAATEEPPDEPDDDVFRRPARRLRFFPLVWQVDETDCGAACLATVCRYFGKRVPLPYVRTVARTGYEGTSLRGLVAGAEALGLVARSLKASKSRLEQLPLPAICHWEGNHWVVLYDTTSRHVRVSDPARGLVRIAREEWDRQWSGYCCLVAPTPALEEVPGPRPVFGWLRQFLRPHRRALVVSVLLALVAAGMQMLLPVVGGRIVDGAIAHHDRAQLNLLALAMAGLLAFGAGMMLMQRWLLARIAFRFDIETLDHVTAWLLSLPHSYMAARRTGDLERRLAGMRLVRLILVQDGVVALSAAAQVAVAVVLMLTYSLPLTAVYLALAPAYALAMVWSRRRLRPLLASLEDAFGRYAASQVDAIKGFESVKATGAEEALRHRMRRQFEHLSGRVYRGDLAVMRYDTFVELAAFSGLALILWVGGLLVLHGSLTVGQLVAFNGLVVLASGPITVLLRFWDDLQLVAVLLGRLDDVLAQEPEEGSGSSRRRPVPTLGGEVRLEGLTVLTDDVRPRAIVDELDLNITPGTTVAIVGRSGAGKSTVVRCLAGLTAPSAGRILYDGIDLATLDHRELRRRVGVVPQDTYLFDDTIAGNIAFGLDEADIEQVRWAARVADAADFIERLPLGYSTRIGEGGIRLSGGQAQRIAIARAVYRRPPVLILDEATAALDGDSERAVKESLDELLEGRTAIIVAHRLSTIRNADLIVVLEGGRIVERGTHQQLIERRGVYWYLVSQQIED